MSASPPLQLKLTEHEAEQLLTILCNTDDEGPCNEGWKSKELTALIDYIRLQCVEQQPELSARWPFN